MKLSILTEIQTVKKRENVLLSTFPYSSLCARFLTLDLTGSQETITS